MTAVGAETAPLPDAEAETVRLPVVEDPDLVVLTIPLLLETEFLVALAELLPEEAERLLEEIELLPEVTELLVDEATELLDDDVAAPALETLEDDAPKPLPVESLEP